VLAAGRRVQAELACRHRQGVAELGCRCCGGKRFEREVVERACAEAVECARTSSPPPASARLGSPSDRVRLASASVITWRRGADLGLWLLLSAVLRPSSSSACRAS
jgi:hypothetical protein